MWGYDYKCNSARQAKCRSATPQLTCRDINSCRNVCNPRPPCCPTYETERCASYYRRSCSTPVRCEAPCVPYAPRPRSVEPLVSRVPFRSFVQTCKPKPVNKKPKITKPQVKKSEPKPEPPPPEEACICAPCPDPDPEEPCICGTSQPCICRPRAERENAKSVPPPKLEKSSGQSLRSNESCICAEGPERCYCDEPKPDENCVCAGGPEQCYKSSNASIEEARSAHAPPVSIETEQTSISDPVVSKDITPERSRRSILKDTSICESICRNKQNKKVTLCTPICEEHEYLHFLLRITEDILRNDLYANEEMESVFESHIKANLGRLDENKMRQQVEKLRSELRMPFQSKSVSPCTCSSCKVMNYPIVDIKGSTDNKPEVEVKVESPIDEKTNQEISVKDNVDFEIVDVEETNEKESCVEIKSKSTLKEDSSFDEFEKIITLGITIETDELGPPVEVILADKGSIDLDITNTSGDRKSGGSIVERKSISSASKQPFVLSLEDIMEERKSAEFVKQTSTEKIVKKHEEFNTKEAHLHEFINTAADGTVEHHKIQDNEETFESFFNKIDEQFKLTFPSHEINKSEEDLAKKFDFESDIEEQLKLTFPGFGASDSATKDFDLDAASKEIKDLLSSPCVLSEKSEDEDCLLCGKEITEANKVSSKHSSLKRDKSGSIKSFREKSKESLTGSAKKYRRSSETSDIQETKKQVSPVQSHDKRENLSSRRSEHSDDEIIRIIRNKSGSVKEYRLSLIKVDKEKPPSDESSHKMQSRRGSVASCKPICTKEGVICMCTEKGFQPEFERCECDVRKHDNRNVNKDETDYSSDYSKNEHRFSKDDISRRNSRNSNMHEKASRHSSGKKIDSNSHLSHASERSHEKLGSRDQKFSSSSNLSHASEKADAKFSTRDQKFGSSSHISHASERADEKLGSRSSRDQKFGSTSHLSHASERDHKKFGSRDKDLNSSSHLSHASERNYEKLGSRGSSPENKISESDQDAGDNNQNVADAETKSVRSVCLKGRTASRSSHQNKINGCLSGVVKVISESDQNKSQIIITNNSVHNVSNKNSFCVCQTGIKIQMDEDKSDDYVLVESPVCLPRALIENKGVPITIQDMSMLQEYNLCKCSPQKNCSTEPPLKPKPNNSAHSNITEKSSKCRSHETVHTLHDDDKPDPDVKYVQCCLIDSKTPFQVKSAKKSSKNSSPSISPERKNKPKSRANSSPKRYPIHKHVKKRPLNLDINKIPVCSQCVYGQSNFKDTEELAKNYSAPVYTKTDLLIYKEEIKPKSASVDGTLKHNYEHIHADINSYALHIEAEKISEEKLDSYDENKKLNIMDYYQNLEKPSRSTEKLLKVYSENMFGAQSFLVAPVNVSNENEPQSTMRIKKNCNRKYCPALNKSLTKATASTSPKRTLETTPPVVVGKNNPGNNEKAGLNNKRNSSDSQTSTPPRSNSRRLSNSSSKSADRDNSQNKIKRNSSGKAAVVAGAAAETAPAGAAAETASAGAAAETALADEALPDINPEKGYHLLLTDASTNVAENEIIMEAQGAVVEPRPTTNTLVLDVLKESFAVNSLASTASPVSYRSEATSRAVASVDPIFADVDRPSMVADKEPHEVLADYAVDPAEQNKRVSETTSVPPFPGARISFAKRVSYSTTEGSSPVTSVFEEDIHTDNEDEPYDLNQEPIFAERKSDISSLKKALFAYSNPSIAAETQETERGSILFDDFPEMNKSVSQAYSNRNPQTAQMNENPSASQVTRISEDLTAKHAQEQLDDFRKVSADPLRKFQFNDTPNPVDKNESQDVTGSAQGSTSQGSPKKAEKKPSVESTGNRTCCGLIKPKK